MVIQRLRLRIVDIQRHHHHGGVCSACAEGTQLFQVADEVAAVIGHRPAPFAQALQLAEALHKRQRQEEEHAKARQPRRNRNPRSSAAREDAHRI